MAHTSQAYIPVFIYFFFFSFLSPSALALPQTCGLSESIEERITDCVSSSSFTTEDEVRLVSRNGLAQEIYLDLTTNSFWTSISQETMNYEAVVSYCEGLNHDFPSPENNAWKIPHSREFNVATSAIKRHFVMQNVAVWMEDPHHHYSLYAKIFTFHPNEEKRYMAYGLQKEDSRYSAFCVKPVAPPKEENKQRSVRERLCDSRRVGTHCD